jgi:competence protein ComEA
MSSIEGPDDSPIATGSRPPQSGLTLPWSWPEGARVLLAILAISAAIGLMVGRRDRPQMAAKPVGEITANALELKLDPNTATPEALAALPHIGPTLARRIAEARVDGPFRSPDDIRARVRGIGPATLAQIQPYLRIETQPDLGPRRDSPSIAIADAGTNPGEPSASTSRKPPRPRTRKAKGSSIQVAAKAGASASP